MMKINILTQSKNELKIEIINEGHTFCNALQSILLNDDSVEFSGYNLPHPLAAHPILYVRTKGRRTPKKALLDAAETLNKELNAIKKTFSEVFGNEEPDT